jgi:hypothetical protein
VNITLDLDQDSDGFIEELETALDTAISWQNDNWLFGPNFFRSGKNSIDTKDLGKDELFDE